MNKSLMSLGAAVAMVVAVSTQAQSPSNEEMWKVIQEQQEEIERLKQEQTQSAEAIEETEKK